jgi:hypothetical protein
LKEQIEYKFPRLHITYYAFAKIFERAGYSSVKIDLTYWKEVHEWLQDNIETYTWTGHIFWFANEEDKKRFEFKFHDYLLP